MAEGIKLINAVPPSSGLEVQGYRHIFLAAVTPPDLSYTVHLVPPGQLAPRAFQSRPPKQHPAFDQPLQDVATGVPAPCFIKAVNGHCLAVGHPLPVLLVGSE